MFAGEELAIARGWEERFASGLLPTLLDMRAAACDPRAGLFDSSSSGQSDMFQRIGDVGVVSISGPLMQQGGGWWFDGHAAIRSRVESAVADGVKVLALRIDSPGGVVAGCFDGVRAAIACAATAGVQVMAWCGGNGAFSAAYAWACAASSISVPDTGGVGSVGVLGTLYDETKQNEMNGVRVNVIRSGERKAEGHPDVPTTDGAIAREQAIVDGFAAIFAGIVSASRMASGGTGAALTPEAVLAFQGECFYGVRSVEMGLADRVESYDSFLARACAMAEACGMKQMNARLGLSPDASEERAIQVFEGIVAGHEAKLRAEGEARAKVEAEVVKLKGETQALAGEFLEYVKGDVLISGKATAATIDAEVALMGSDDKVRSARAFRDRYAPIARGAAVPRETQAPVEPPATVGPATSAARAAAGADAFAKLDGGKMTMTEIGAAYGTEHFDRLVTEHTRAHAATDAARFARLNHRGA